MTFIYIILIAHILFSIKVTTKVYKSNLLDVSQKRINIILTWVIPFLWGFIASSVVKESKVEATIKRGKRGRRSNSNSDNWESLTGYGGDGGFD